jgi:hypothetical protein
MLHHPTSPVIFVLFLDSNRWVGRQGAHFLPPPSLDLTPLDFVFWGFAKGIVYREKFQDMNWLYD